MSTNDAGDASVNGCESPVPSCRSLRRKPVPTPRNTLKKPTLSRRQPDQDSQGQTSIDSTSPDDESGTNGTHTAANNIPDPDSNQAAPDGDDILAALEKIPGVGSLRSSVQSSLGSSLPSLTLDRVKREESSHSLESTSFSDKSTDRLLPLKLKRFNTERPRLRKKMSNNEPGSISKPETPIKTKENQDDHDENNIDAHPGDNGVEKELKSPRVTIQTRPLPDLPDKSKESDKISVINDNGAIQEADEEGEAVYSTLLSPDHYSELKERPISAERQSLIKRNQSFLTMTGTMKKGRLKRDEAIYDVQLGFSQEHLSKLEKRVHDKYHDRCFCGLRRGIHVFILSVLALPFVLVYSTALAFYQGTLTWYNIFIYYNEERGCCWKLLSPLILLCYPFWIVPITIVLGLFGALYQLSWYLDSWLEAVTAPDGGFFAWFCNYIEVPEAGPYQIIVLTNPGGPPEHPTCTAGAIML